MTRAKFNFTRTSSRLVHSDLLYKWRLVDLIMGMGLAAWHMRVIIMHPVDLHTVRSMNDVQPFTGEYLHIQIS